MLAPAPIFSWTGFYVGANAGYGWGRSSNDWNFFAPNSSTGNTDCSPTGQATCFSASETNNLNGVIGGVQLGYNWQFNRNWLLGIETDFQGSAQQTDHNSFNVNFIANTLPVTASVSYTEKMPWFGTLRGRLGYISTERWLLYATGGLAYGRVNFDGSAVATGFLSPFVPGSPPCPASPCPVANFGTGVTKAGWTVGAGAEWAVGGPWSVKAEYLYIDLGSVDTAFPTVPGCRGVPGFACNNTAAGIGTISSKVTDNIFRLGLNYKLF